MAGRANCEHCINFEFDEECGCCICIVDLDEDEYERFLHNSFDNCPYFQFNDEYKTVRKQI